jgi:hypothetical protein
MWFLDTNKYINFLCKHKITAGQFLLLYLTLTKDMGNLYKYVHEVKPWDKKDTKDLEERGYLINMNTGDNSFGDMYVVQEKFYKEMWVDLDFAGEELWETYPAFFIISGGKKLPARSCDKDKLVSNYHRLIKTNMKKHKEVIELLKIAVSRNEINMGIEKWVGSEQWKILKEEYGGITNIPRHGEQEFTEN